jgi:hypothetical protein
MMRILVFCLCLIFSTPAIAAISFVDGRWSSTFNCSEWTQGGNLNCDGVSPGGTWTCQGKAGQITTAANNPAGGGGKGFRHWQGDGSNVNSGGISINFPSPQREFWIRWYHRYEAGFKWSYLNYDKILYIRTKASGKDVIPEYKYNDQYLVYAQGGSNPSGMISNNGTGWRNVMGGAASDGRFHVHELYLKMDTNGTNGIGRYWIDGKLIISKTNVNYSNGSSLAREGWLSILVGSNQSSPANGRPMYVDYDDIAIYRTTPPNVDAHGNRFIGPIKSSSSSSGSTNPPPQDDPISQPITSPIEPPTRLRIR